VREHDGYVEDEFICADECICKRVGDLFWEFLDVDIYRRDAWDRCDGEVVQRQLRRNPGWNGKQPIRITDRDDRVLRALRR